MKSRTSCFNTAVLKKNLTLYWPIWAIYTACMMISLMGKLWTNIHYHIRWGTLDERRNLQIMSDSINPSNCMFIIIIMSIVTAMALHSYLFTSKSCNMMHAFPITRGELYRTNVFTGLLFMVVPIVITFIASIFLCISYGITRVEYLGVWFVVMTEAAIICYALATFCAMFTGQIFALPIYFAAANIIGPGVIDLIFSILNFLGFGLKISVNMNHVSWTSPVYFISKNVYLKGRMDTVEREYLCTELQFFGMKPLTIYLVVAVILFVAAYVIYRKRPLEQAGNLLTVAWLKPVFRWGIGICGGFAGAFVIVGLLEGILGTIGKGWILFLSVLIGCGAFFIAQMFIEKKFRVFCKRIWIECGCLCVTVFAVFGALFVTKRQMENYIPAAEQIAEATVNLSYECAYTGEDVREVIALHKAILAKKDSFTGFDSWSDNCAGIKICYSLKNGKVIERYYNIPSDGEGEEIVAYCLEQEADPEHFINNFLHAADERIEYVTEGEFELYDRNYNYIRGTKFTPEQIDRIFAAAKEDAEEGNLQKYNLISSWENRQFFCCNLNLHEPYVNQEEYTISVDNSMFGGKLFYDESETCNIYINIGEDCTHIIDELLRIGAVKSIDELQVYEDEEK